MSRKPVFFTYLDKSVLCAAVGVVIAAVFRPTRTSQRGCGGGVFLFSVYSSALLLVLGLLSIGAFLYCFLRAIFGNK